MGDMLQEPLRPGTWLVLDTRGSPPRSQGSSWKCRLGRPMARFPGPWSASFCSHRAAGVGLPGLVVTPPPALQPCGVRSVMAALSSGK